MRVVVLLAWPLLAWSSPLPDKPHPSPQFGGFQPIHAGRGAGPSSGFHGPSIVPPSPRHQPHPHPPPPQEYNQHAAPPTVPTKTIYVNVPAPDHPPPPPPVAAGPPRKHYKIVFIRAPAPPPQAQAILPPRTEQKTVIYVLHQRPEEQQQQVVQVPHIPHDPQVFFVEYDTPPTAHDLQQLSSGNLDGFSVTPQHANTDQYGGLQVVDEGSYQSDLFKRQVEEAAEAAEAAGEDVVYT